jgi:hypothetical protein
MNNNLNVTTCRLFSPEQRCLEKNAFQCSQFSFLSVHELVGDQVSPINTSASSCPGLSTENTATFLNDQL